MSQPVHHLLTSDACVNPDPVYNRANGKTVLLATGGGNATYVEIKDLTTGTTIRELPIPEARVTKVAFSGTGPTARGSPLHLAVACANGRVYVFDLSSNDTDLNKYKPYDGHRAPVVAVGFEPNGSFVYSASNDGTLQTWRPQLSKTHSSTTSSLLSALPADISRSGNASPSSVTAFQGPFTPAKLKNWLDMGNPYPAFVAFADATYYPPGDLFFTTDQIGRLRAWSHESGRCILDMRPHKKGRPLNCMEISEDFQFLVAANYDGFVFVYKIREMLAQKEEMPPATFLASSSYILRLHLTRSNRSLICTTETEGVKIFDIGTVMRYAEPQQSVRHLESPFATPHREIGRFGPYTLDAVFYQSGTGDEKHIVTSTNENEIALHDVDNVHNSRIWRGLRWPVATMAVKQLYS